MEQSNDQMADGTTKRFVVFLRVSTSKQGADGLGIAAQEREIQQFLGQQQDAEVVQQFVEVESGAREVSARPLLCEALDLCRRTSSTLIVARLSRLSRDAATVLNLMKDTTIRFCVAAMPSATNLQLGIYALLNEEDRRSIRSRTKSALAAAKERGVQLGNPNLAEMNRTRKREARNYAEQHAPLIWSLRNKGKTLREICSVLNDANITTRAGGMFHSSQVHRILQRTTEHVTSRTVKGHDSPITPTSSTHSWKRIKRVETID